MQIISVPVSSLQISGTELTVTGEVVDFTIFPKIEITVEWLDARVLILQVRFKEETIRIMTSLF